MLYIRILFILSLLLSFSFADDDAQNDACPAELISEMDGITSSKSHEEGPAYFTKNVDDEDYYSFTIDADGTLDIYYVGMENTDVYVNTSACRKDNGDKVINNASTGSTQLNITTGTTVYVLVSSGKTQTYGIDFQFEAAAPPVANDDYAETTESVAVDIDVTANDTDDGSIDKTTVTIVSPVSNGTTSIDGTTGVVTYTPTANFTGTDSFTYTVEDNLGNLPTVEATVLITVKPETVSVENCVNGTDQGYRDFCLRKQTMLPGDMLTTGNTVLVRTDADCSTYTNGAYIDATTSNGYVQLCQYHVDGAGTPPATTAELVIPDPANSTIEFAGLYWQSRVSTSTEAVNSALRIRNNGGSYVSIGSPDRVDWEDNGESNAEISYSGFKDITSIFTSQGWKDGNFTVADVPAFEGNPNDGLGLYGAWNLVVIYRNDQETIRSFSVFDGWKVVKNVTGYRDVDITPAGFYTPKDGDINAKLSVFAAEGDYSIENDLLRVEDQTNGNALVTIYDTATQSNDNSFDSSINGVNSRTPDPVNNMGIDIHSYEMGTNGFNVLDHEQNYITFHFTSTQDTYWPSVLAFATEVYTPSFCYDYTFKQNGVYLTRYDDNLTATPRLTGTVTDNDDLTVTLYIRNQEDSDVDAKNLSLSITDINTTQAVYKRESVAIINPDEVVAKPVADSSLIVSDSYVQNIGFEDVGGTQYIYAYYTLTPDLPASSNHELDMLLNASFSFDLVLPLADGSEITIPSQATLGGTNLPICADAGSGYITEKYWSFFNVQDTALSSTEFYNIPTQVVGRMGNFTITAYDKNASDYKTGANRETNSTTLIGVDLIDAGAFHDIIATCSETTAGISPIIWMNFDNSDKIDFRAKLQSIASACQLDASSNDCQTYITDANDYFPNAIQSAAFRIHYLTTNDGDEDLIKTEPGNVAGNVKLLNFTELVQDIHTCKQPVRKFPGSDLYTELVPVACANAGNQGLNPFELQRCLECLFGYNTSHICSRDNFSIRPESFNVKLNDVDQANTTNRLRFADDRTGVDSASLNPSPTVFMSAGYQYYYEVNATNHYDNEAVAGYSRFFTESNKDDYNMTLVWEPSNTAVNPFCNDINSTIQEFNMLNGQINDFGSHGNVGEYRLNITDASWTEADWVSTTDPINKDRWHQQDTTHFIQTTDCDTTTTDVISDASFASGTGLDSLVAPTTMTNINGCTITTSNHDNVDGNSGAGISYRDYDIVFRPYDLNTSLINFNHGNEQNLDFTNAWVYMNAMSIDDNESVNIVGNIEARGFDGNVTSNFVAGCYAEPITLNISGVFPAPANMPVGFNFLLFDTNSTGDTIATVRGDLNTSGTLLPTGTLPPAATLNDGNFTKDMLGATTIDLSMNFERTITTPINPMAVTFNDFTVNCTTAANCQMQANLVSNHEALGNVDLNATVNFYYGRSHAPRYRVEDNSGVIALYHEIYCDNNNPINSCVPSSHPTVFPNQLLSVDDIRWYQNQDHNATNDGASSSIVQSSSNSATNEITVNNPLVNAYIQQWDVTYDGTQGYPFKNQMNISTDSWLLFNRFNGNAPFNQFELEFNTAGQMTTVDDNGNPIHVDSKANTNTSRRSEW
jgi:hypothetical protein